MTKQKMIELVGRYFAAVDSENFEAIQTTLTEDCVFTVETHAIQVVGLDEIREMFGRLWADHAAVRHYDFVHVAAPDDGRIATRFSVINTHRDGRQVHKSNSNFFEIRDGLFNQVAVYMAGENTLMRL